MEKLYGEFARSIIILVSNGTDSWRYPGRGNSNVEDEEKREDGKENGWMRKLVNSKALIQGILEGGCHTDCIGYALYNCLTSKGFRFRSSFCLSINTSSSLSRFL